jgi:two-component sensor histidine kinase/tetratricopeptide (TPR) repeat protein
MLNSYFWGMDLKLPFPIYIFFLFVLFGCNLPSPKQTEDKRAVNDSVSYWLDSLTMDDPKKGEAISKAIQILKKDGNDSLLLKAYLLKSSHFSKRKQYKQAILVCDTLFHLAAKNNNDTVLAKTFFSLAYYKDLENMPTEAFSDYQKGLETYLKIGDSVMAAKVILNMCTVQNSLGDFYGAQQNAIKGLKFLEGSSETEQQFKLYNSLAIACSNALQYEEAHRAYSRSLDFISTFDKKINIKNNIAVNLNKQERFKESLEILQPFVNDKGLDSFPTLQARVWDNYGYTLFKITPNTGLQFMERARDMREKNGDLQGAFASYIHLCDYYSEHDPTNALGYSERAYEVAHKMKSPDAKVEALEYLVRLKPNPKHEAILLLNLHDSIQEARQGILEKFSATKYQTEKKDKENLALKQQNAEQALLTEKERTQKWAIGGGLAVSLAGLGIFFIAFNKNKKQKRKIEKQKNEIEKLQRELHHRLKNNLAFIDFFITLAKGKFPDPAYRQKLDELQNRINSMFEVHKQLFKKDDITSVNAKTYISALVENVKKAYASENIHIHENIKDTNLNAAISFPIGLIVNEFVTNSFKYAFSETEKGIISVELNEDAEKYQLKLSDNGKGLPHDFDINILNSFGLETIKLLAEEYKGSFKLDGTNGTRMDITFPKNAA